RQREDTRDKEADAADPTNRQPQGGCNGGREPEELGGLEQGRGACQEARCEEGKRPGRIAKKERTRARRRFRAHLRRSRESREATNSSSTSVSVDEWHVWPRVCQRDRGAGPAQRLPNHEPPTARNAAATKMPNPANSPRTAGEL